MDTKCLLTLNKCNFLKDSNCGHMNAKGGGLQIAESKLTW